MNFFKYLIYSSILMATAASCQTIPGNEDLLVKIPKLENFVADGSAAEWADIPSTRLYADPLGGYPDPDDLEVHLKAAWNEDHILLLLEIRDEFILTDTVHPWKADAIEVFLAPMRGSQEILQLEVVPGEERKGESFTNYFDHRKKTCLREVRPEFSAISQRFNQITTVEIAIDPASVGVEPGAGNSLAMQIYVDDKDQNGESKQVQWYSIGHAYTSSFAMFPVELTLDETYMPQGASRIVITDEKAAELYVFGARKGDLLEVFSGNERLVSKHSGTFEQWKPDSFNLSQKNLDFQNDQIRVNVNGNPIGIHELYFAPREYKETRRRPFDREIRNFVMMDRQQMPPENAVLFIGSSSIRKWNSLKEDFPELEIIHRGFGGSTTEEALMYMDEIVLPYKPSAILIYEGDNDVPRGYSTEKIRQNMRTFIERVHKEKTETQIFIISPKPSIARMNYWGRYKQVHEALRDLAGEYPFVSYIDVSGAMFDDGGKLIKDIFAEDGVHMNERGYAIWTRVIREHLNL